MTTLKQPIDVIFFNSKPMTKNELMTTTPTERDSATADRGPVRETLNELEGKPTDLEKPADIPPPPYDEDKVFASFVVGGSIILAAIGLAVALFIHS